MRNKWEIELPLQKETWEIGFSSPEGQLVAELGGVIPYTLPIASEDQLGGVQPVKKTEEMTAPVGVDEEGRLWVNAQKQTDDDVETDEVDEYDAIVIALKTGLIGDIPVAEDGAVYTDENGDIYIL